LSDILTLERPASFYIIEGKVSVILLLLAMFGYPLFFIINFCYKKKCSVARSFYSGVARGGGGRVASEGTRPGT